MHCTLLQLFHTVRVLHAIVAREVKRSGLCVGKDMESEAWQDREAGCGTSGGVREEGNSLTQPQQLSIKSTLPNRENINLTLEVSFPFAVKYFSFEKKKK